MKTHHLDVHTAASVVFTRPLCNYVTLLLEHLSWPMWLAGAGHPAGQVGPGQSLSHLLSHLPSAALAGNVLLSLVVSHF